MELLLLGRIFIFQSLQEASLQTLGVDMCEDMTELEFLHNELAWTLNASSEPRFFLNEGTFLCGELMLTPRKPKHW